MFDKKEFVQSVIESGRSLDQIVDEARVDILLIESHSIRPVGCSDYAEFLRALVVFLQGGDMPINISDDDFQLLLPLAQHFVDRGDLESDILELFGE